MKNIFEFSFVPQEAQEKIETLVESGNIEKGQGVRLERILSFGAKTPDGVWYDQSWEEWVMVIKGNATLEFDNGEKIDICQGDYLTIRAHERHRVSRTSVDCLWLALHFTE